MLRAWVTPWKKSPWGRLFDGLELSGERQCMRPLWASLSRAFALQACASPQKHVKVCLGKSASNSIFLAEEYPILHQAHMLLRYEIVSPPVQEEMTLEGP